MGTLDPVLRKLNHRSSAVRSQAMGDLDRDLRLTAARIGVTDPDVLIRGDSACILAEVGTSLDRHRVRLLLKDEDWFVRSDAVWAVEKVFGASALKVLLPMLEDSHYIVRRDAAVNLGLLGKASAVDPLERALAVELTDQGKLGMLEALVRFGQMERFRDLVGLHSSDEPGMDTATWSTVTDVVSEVSLLDEHIEHVIQTVKALCEGELTRSVSSTVYKLLDALHARYPAVELPPITTSSGLPNGDPPE